MPPETNALIISPSPQLAQRWHLPEQSIAMKLFLQVNKVLLVIATLCFIFIFILRNDLAAHGRSHRTVLYHKTNCNEQLLIQEEEGAIVIRAGEASAGQTYAADFRPGPVAKLTID